MRKLNPIGFVLLAALSGCGLENLFTNAGHVAYDRPASQISGVANWQPIAPFQFSVIDGNGKAFEKEQGPFQLTVGVGTYSIKLPSSTYSMVRVQARAGNLLLRSLVPIVGPESMVSANLDARGMTEALIVETNLSATRQNLSLLIPSAYDDPITGAGTRKKIRADMEVAGPAQDLLRMVERVIPLGETRSGDPDPGYFNVPVSAMGVLTIGGGIDARFTAGKVLAIDGVTLTEGVDFAQGGDDAESAKAIANAINGHAALKILVRATYTQGGAATDSTVIVTSLMPGDAPNGITLTTDATSAHWAHPSLVGGISPLSAPWLTSMVALGTPVDYTGDGTADTTTAAFDALLGQVARSYRPEGCPDPTRIRLVFTVDFNQGAISGSCNVVNRFLWTTDKPGKKMFFVGWLHKDSGFQNPQIGQLLGNGIPNQLEMHDDGTNGDEVANDGVYTISFDVPRDPSGIKKLRIGYKYTWGFKGQQWTGTEEWPGNSRIIQVDDMNGDGFVYRRDVYQDEASNKDLSNLNPKGNGTLGWDTDLRRCGTPEAREQMFDNVSPGNMCTCGTAYYSPPNLATINSACP
jgi:hypothetical protein